MAIAAIFAGCSKDEDFVKQEGVTLDKSTLTLNVADFVELGAKINPESATSNYLIWKTSDSKIATVTGHGQVAAIGPDYNKIGDGTAKITATTADGKQVAECVVTVKPVKATGVTIEPEVVEGVTVTGQTVEIEENASVNLKAIVAPNNAKPVSTPDPNTASYNTNKWLTWESSDPSVATIEGDNAEAEKFITAKGHKEGTSTITVKTDDGGFVGTITVKVKAPAMIDLWVSDEASSCEFKMGGKADAENAGKWLKYDAKTNTVSWTANTTGAVRSDTLEMVGAKAIITQISEKDFKNMTLKAKLFDPNKTLGKGNTNASETAVTFEAAKGENGNNVTIKGLYLDAAIEGKLDIDYENKSYKLGVYLSHDKIYDAGNGKYCVVLPGTSANGTVWGAYNFCPSADKAFSDTNYDWLWFNLNDNGDLKYQYANASSKFVGQASANDKFWICALSIVKASATAITGTAYDVVYQANYNGSNESGMWFAK